MPQRSAPPVPVTAEQVAQQLAMADHLDFDVVSNQRWDDLTRTHADDVAVYWPEGRVTKGLTRHIEDLQEMFVFAPDIHIRDRSIKFGAGEWTSVVGVVAGTFTQPLPLPGGSVLPPTYRTFRIRMNTVARWNAEGKIVEEFLFWDRISLFEQVGRGVMPVSPR